MILTLPVDEIRADFLDALDASKPTIVTAPTGSGKSTRLPLWMADACVANERPILVVEPRRVACRSLAAWLSEQRGEKVGQSIGYRVRFDDRTSAHTEVIFATTGVALRMLAAQEEADESRFSGVLIDEFHERSWQVDLIAAILLARAKSAQNRCPLVITSATLDVAALTRQLRAHGLTARHLEARGRSYPVDIRYLDTPAAPSAQGLERRVADAVRRAAQRDSESTTSDGEGGDILVFLPGKGEITTCMHALSGVAKQFNLDPVAVHGGLPPDRMKRALARSKDQRRVYLSTNVAETSVTLPGVTCVIDSGLARMRIHRGGRSALALVPIAKDAMDQRAGRAGRVRPGRCIRLWSQRFSPAPTTTAEVERIELDDVLLHAGVCGLDGAAFDRAPWITEPPAFAVAQARARLSTAGALDPAHQMTPKGRQLAKLPVDGHAARMLIGADDATAGVACDLVALLQLNRGLLSPTSSPDAHHQRATLLDGVDNEVFAEIATLRAGDPRRHDLHASALSEARKVATSLREWVGAPIIDPTRDTLDFPPTADFARYLLARVPETACVLRQRALKRRAAQKTQPGQPEPWSNGELELSVWPYQPPRRADAPAQKPADAPVAGLVLDHFWLGDTGTGVRGIGRMLLPCSYRALADAGLGQESVGQAQILQKNGAPHIVALVERDLAGVVISSREEALRGPNLIAIVSNFILAGRNFPGGLLKNAGTQLRDDLHLWQVLADWPEPERYWEHVEAPQTPDDFLQAQLQTLGLQSAEELALLETHDLRPDLADTLGITAYDLERFADDFPRQWEHMGQRYRCDVQAGARKVVLEPADKKTRKAPDPNPAHLPRFRGFSVYYRNASRVVKLR